MQTCCQSIKNLGAPPWCAELYSILKCRFDVHQDLAANVSCFKNVKDQLKDNVTKSALAQIVQLEEDGFIAIISNSELNSLLQPLHDSKGTSIKDANQNAAKLLEKSLKA